ncbi:MAG: adenylate/guanylate cyclase domain-containing protein [Flammeovirgaceae bacterium]
MKSRNPSKRIYLIALGSIIVLSTYFTFRDYYDTLKYKELDHLDELRTLASTLGSFIDGDELASLMKRFPTKDAITSNTQDSVYLAIHHLLLKVQQANGLNSPPYTLTYDPENGHFLFGVTAAEKPYFRHEYSSFNQRLLQNYEVGGVIEPYEDDHGYWMSAFTPIKDGNGHVVGVIQVDNRFEDFKKEANIGLWENAAISLIITLLIAFLLYGNLRNVLRKEEQYKTQIASEKERSESLLLNILPLKIADELKQFGKVKPEYHKSVTVVFTDFTKFTKFTELLSPHELVEELNLCFSFFDGIVEKYNLEKLKTIGDAYMFAGGVPEDRNDNSTCCLRASLEILAFIKQRRAQKLADGLPCFNVKIGIHTGPVVAGVVGKNKFVYDIWGDAVNVAARMEQACEAGRINVSQSTYELEKSSFVFESRGMIEAKHKGSLEMYYLQNERKHNSETS